MLWHLISFYALMLYLSLSLHKITCERIEKRAIDLNEVADFVDIVENEDIASTDSVKNSIKKVNDIEIELPDGIKTILPVHVRNATSNFASNSQPAKSKRRQVYNSVNPTNYNTNNINNDYRGDRLQHLISFKMRQFKPKIQLRRKRRQFRRIRKRFVNLSPVLTGGDSKSYLGNLALATNDAFLKMQNYAATLMVLVTTEKPDPKKEARLTWPRYTENPKTNTKKHITVKGENLLFKRKLSNDYRRQSYTKSLHKNEKNKYRKVPIGSTKRYSSQKHTTPEIKYSTPDSEASKEKSIDSKRQGDKDDVEGFSKISSTKTESDNKMKLYIPTPGNMNDLLRVINTNKIKDKPHENEGFKEISISSISSSKITESIQSSHTPSITPRSPQNNATHLPSQQSPKSTTQIIHTKSTGYASTVNFVPKKNPYAWENEILQGSMIKIKKDVPMDISKQNVQFLDQRFSPTQISKHAEENNQIISPLLDQPSIETVETENMISSGFHHNSDLSETLGETQTKSTVTIVPPAIATAGYELDSELGRIESLYKNTEATPNIRQAEESKGKEEPAASPETSASTPAVSTPEASTPVESTPVASTPVVSTPAVSTPAESTPAESTPAESTPAASTVVPSSPAAITNPTEGEKSNGEPSQASPLATPTMADTSESIPASEHGNSENGNSSTTCADAKCAKVIQNNAIYNIGPDCDTDKEQTKGQDSGGIDIPSKEEVEEMERISQKERATKDICGQTTTESCGHNTTVDSSCTTTPASSNSKQTQDGCDNNDDEENDSGCDEGSGQAPNIVPPCKNEDQQKKVHKIKPKYRLRRQIPLITPSPSSTTPRYTIVKLPNMNLPMLAQPTQLTQINPVHINQVRAVDTPTISNNQLLLGSNISTSAITSPAACVTAVKKSVDRNIIESVVENLKIVDQKLAEAVDPLHTAQEALDNASKCDTTTAGCPGDNVLADISDSERNALQKLAYKIINSPKVKRSDVKPSRIKNGNIVKRGLIAETKKDNQKLDVKKIGKNSDYYDIGDLNQEISRLDRDLTIANELQDILDDIKKDTLKNNVVRSKRKAAYLNPGIVEEREDNMAEGQKPSKPSHKHAKSKHKHANIKQHSLTKKEQHEEDEDELFGRKKKKKKKKKGHNSNWIKLLIGKRREDKGFLDKNHKNSQFAEK